MNTGSVARLGIVAALLALALAACAPNVQKFGPAIHQPLFGPDFVTTADGMRLPLRVWQAENPRAIVVATHGFNDYSRAFEKPAEYWAKNGITTYAYDQRGFGRTKNKGFWAGTEVLVRDLDTVSALVARRHPGVPLYLLGESMGGALVLTAMSRPDAPKVAGIILVAPAVWGWSNMNLLYSSTLWLGAHTVPWKTFTGENLNVVPCDNREILRQMWRDPYVIKATRTDALYGLVGMMDRGFLAAPRVSVPTLVLYGKKDQIVPAKPVRRMVKSLTAPHRFVLYPRGYHMLMRDVHGPMVWQDVQNWIGDFHTAMLGEDQTGKTLAATPKPDSKG